MSISQLVNKDFIVDFAHEDCKIYHKNDTKMEGVHLFNAPHVDNLSLMATIWNGQMLVR
jgi:hypothetical protein